MTRVKTVLKYFLEDIQFADVFYYHGCIYPKFYGIIVRMSIAVESEIPTVESAD